MSLNAAPARPGPNRPDADPAASRLAQLRQRARAALLWESGWPIAVSLLCVVGLFLIVSWLGAWAYLPRWGRIAGLALFALAALACFIPLWRVRLPDDDAALARIDRDSALPHRPAATLADSLANPGADPFTRALWAAHQRRARDAAQRLTVAAPRPRMAARDVYALRGAIAVGVVAAAFVAGPEKYARLLTAFDFNAAGSITQGYRLDAWIDPPPYTGRPPILLKAQADDGKPQPVVRAPVGSTVIVRSSEGAGVSAAVEGGLAPPKSTEKADAAGGGDKAADGSSRPADKSASKPVTPPSPARAGLQSDVEQRWRVDGDGKLTLKRLGRTIASFEISATPDRAPTIALVGEPRLNARGSLTLRYKLDDDYGVLGAEAEFSRPVIAGKPVTGRTLIAPPKMTLGLASGPGGLGEAETTTDLSESPWAGARVLMTLTARDEAGNVGRSDPKEMTLPQRAFTQPLARALIEQRRNLVLAPDDRARIGVAMAALMVEPEEFGVKSGVYLGLYTIARRLGTSRTDDDLRAVADLMWEMALRIEEGDLSAAERDLRAAQKALRDALERGAPDEEIKRLMDELRAALDRYLRDFAQRNPPDNRQASPNDRTITSQDLRSLLDRLEREARQGNRADAQRMLDQLQNLLENLQQARPGQDPGSREMNRALNQLDQMLRDQQALRDRTFRESQRDPDEKGDGNNNRPNDPSDELRRQQEGLRKQLEDMQKRMQQFGLGPEQGFKDAEEAMRDAEKKLGQGKPGQGPAADAQGKALEALRRGAQSLAQQLQQQQGPGQAGPGQGDPNGRQGRDTANPDPLGREQRNRGDNSNALYDPPGAPAAQRAQRILEELRKRLGDPSRPTIELDYLERLLKPY